MSLQKTFVLGLDGIPYSMIIEKMYNKEMPNLQSISEVGMIRRMESVYPTISSVAWTSYATGKNPGNHGIYGFIDRHENPFEVFIPTSKDRKAETIWTKLSIENRKVISINVPLTYPPEEINGKMVSCFLCSDIKKSTYPKDFYKYLESKEYIIDVDAWLVRESKAEFLDSLFLAMSKRFEVTFELMDSEEWDFCQLHIMETDRLMHFFWDEILKRDTPHLKKVNEFFNTLDFYIGELFKRLPKDIRLVILSDHGFCEIKSEVQLNKWLESEGFLKFEAGKEKKLANYSKESICYSLLPGRIYINLEGREEKGSVSSCEYNKVRQLIKNRIYDIKNPINNEKIIDKVFFKEEIYSGDYIDKAADLIVHPINGYDLKGSMDCEEIFSRSVLNGMHTQDDAMIIGINIDISEINSISEVADIILGSGNP